MEEILDSIWLELNPEQAINHKERPPWCNTKAAFKLYFFNYYDE